MINVPPYPQPGELLYQYFNYKVVLIEVSLVTSSYFKSTVSTVSIPFCAASVFRTREEAAAYGLKMLSVEISQIENVLNEKQNKMLELLQIVEGKE